MTRVGSGALRQVPQKHQDRAWQKRIETAKQARLEGKKARKGKSGTFATRRVAPNQ